MKKELEKLTKEELVAMIKKLEYYSSVTMNDDKGYILSYLEDEACTISEKEMAKYLLEKGVEITKDNIYLYYEFMSSVQKSEYKDILNTIFKARNKVIEEFLHIDLSQYDLTVFETSTSIDGVFIIGQNIFKIEDTLKIIDEYIEEIKNSDKYKQYIENKKEQEEDVLVYSMKAYQGDEEFAQHVLETAKYATSFDNHRDLLQEMYPDYTVVKLYTYEHTGMCIEKYCRCQFDSSRDAFGAYKVSEENLDKRIEEINERLDYNSNDCYDDED